MEKILEKVLGVAFWAMPSEWFAPIFVGVLVACALQVFVVSYVLEAWLEDGFERLEAGPAVSVRLLRAAERVAWATYVVGDDVASRVVAWLHRVVDWAGRHFETKWNRFGNLSGLLANRASVIEEGGMVRRVQILHHPDAKHGYFVPVQKARDGVRVGIIILNPAGIWRQVVKDMGWAEWPCPMSGEGVGVFVTVMVAVDVHEHIHALVADATEEQVQWAEAMTGQVMGWPMDFEVLAPPLR